MTRAACDARSPFRNLRPTLQRLCLCTMDRDEQEYRVQNACPFTDLRTLHRNIVLPRSSLGCSGCDKMMPFGQKLATRLVARADGDRRKAWRALRGRPNRGIG